jgi:hypothetical protein
VAYAINTSVTRTTQQTPFYLMFGRHPRTVVDILVDSPPQLASPVGEWARKLFEARRIAAAKAGLARGLTAPEQRGDEERPAVLEVGQLVLVKFTGKKRGQSRKTLPRQQGPYRITKVFDGVSAHLENVDDPSDRIRRNADALVEYRDGGKYEVLAEDEFEIHQIVAERKIGSITEYKVRFVGYGDEEDVWYPREDLLEGGSKVIAQWEKNGGGRVDHQRFVHRIIRENVEKGGRRIFLCAEEEDAGPESFEWLTRDQIKNTKIIDRFYAEQRLVVRDSGKTKKKSPKNNGQGGRGARRESGGGVGISEQPQPSRQSARLRNRRK